LSARVLVTGSRDWTDAALIEQALDAALALLGVSLADEKSVTLVHGDAKGLDTLVKIAATRRGWTVESYPAQWGTHTAACPAWHAGLATCKMAGHRRNHEMIALGADLVIAFPMGNEASGESRGTWGCARAAMNAALPTVVLWHESFHPWGPKAERLVTAERKACARAQAPTVQSPGQPSTPVSDSAPAKLSILLPIPF
jgi:hypothetical protein